jgi:hypothetical protein
MAYVSDETNRVVRIVGDVIDGSPEETEFARSAPAGTSLVALECGASVGDVVAVDSDGIASEVVS